MEQKQSFFIYFIIIIHKIRNKNYNSKIYLKEKLFSSVYFLLQFFIKLITQN